MKYYIFKHDWELDVLKSEDPFDPYIEAPMTLGITLENIPKITLSFKSKNIPDSIPNFNGGIVFNQNIISVLKEAKIDYIQYFDVDVKDSTGNLISDNYKCLNVVKVIDAIDRENSNLKWSDLEGEETEEDRFVRDVLDLRLNYQSIDNEPIFRLEHCESLLLFREDIAQEIVNKRCTGLEFYNAEGFSF